MNTSLRIATMLLFIPLMAFAQENSGSIHGTIIGPQDENVSYMWVRANDADSAEAGRGESTVGGAYRISNLPAGSYTLEINTPCCAYLNFDSESIELAEGQALEFEIRLKEGDSFNTVGDDPGVVAAAMRSEAIIPDEPAPRMANGKPDLSGVWLVGADPYPEKVEAHPWAEELFQERASNYGVDHPHLRCLPGDAPITGGAAPFIAKFVHKPDLLIILMEDYPGFRQVFMDGREHPEDPNPSWMGNSIGHWDGDTLVVDTIGFNDRGWMGLYPRSEDLHIVERYSRNEFGVMSLTYTIDDPTVYKKQRNANIPLHLAPQEELIEYVCENNKWAGVSGN